MRDLVDQDNIPENNTSMDNSIDWKASLKKCLAPSIEEVNRDRAWGVLCQNLREACPETEWISFYQRTKFVTSQQVVEFHNFIKFLVTHPQWPFPEKILLSLTPSRAYPFEIHFLNIKFDMALSQTRFKNTAQVLYDGHSLKIAFSPKRRPIQERISEV